MRPGVKRRQGQVSLAVDEHAVDQRSVANRQAQSRGFGIPHTVIESRPAGHRVIRIG
jgi:hypothetical protein